MFKFNKHKFQILFLLGVGLWILETWYFGWNEKPSCPLESMLDTLSFCLMFWGIIGDITSGVSFSKIINVTTQKVIIEEGNKNSKSNPTPHAQ